MGLQYQTATRMLGSLFQGTDFINNKIGIVNTPATPQDKKDKPKQP